MSELAKSHLVERRCRLHQRGPDRKRVGTPSVQSSPDDYQQWQRRKERMIRSGWCSHQVNHLSLKYDLETFLYLTTLERSPLRHADRQRFSLHESCVAYNTHPTNNETRHTTADCACPMICVPYESLIKIIRKGRVPLLSIESGSADASERHKLQVQPRSRTSKYVAVSHVWADGLGNPNANGLPSCQIEGLKASVPALQPVCSCHSKEQPLCSKRY